MSDASFPTPDDGDLSAAEYVLGVTDTADRAAFEARLRGDAALAASVADWEERLSGLNDGFAEVPAPDVFPGVEARLFGRAAATPSRFAALRGWLVGGIAASALALLAVFYLVPGSATPTLGTTLAADAQPLRFEAQIAGDDLTLVRVAGTQAEAGRVYQLWLIAGEAAPVPLGLVTGESLTVTRAGLAPGMVLAVSLEPAGGSPTGLPTGPVLVTGALSDL